MDSKSSGMVKRLKHEICIQIKIEISLGTNGYINIAQYCARDEKCHAMSTQFLSLQYKFIVSKYLESNLLRCHELSDNESHSNEISTDKQVCRFHQTCSSVTLVSTSESPFWHLPSTA